MVSSGNRAGERWYVREKGVETDSKLGSPAHLGLQAAVKGVLRAMDSPHGFSWWLSWASACPYSLELGVFMRVTHRK